MIQKKKYIGYLVFAALLVLVLMYSRQIFRALNSLWGIILPLVIGCALAYVLNLIMVRLEKLLFSNLDNRYLNRCKSLVCLVLAVVLIVLVLFFITNLVLPQLANAIAIFSASIPGFIDRLLQTLDQIELSPLVLEQIENMFDSQADIRDQIFKFATKGIGGVLSSASAVVGSVGSAVFGFFVAFSFAVYILAGKTKLAQQADMIGRAFIPEQWLERIKLVLATADETFSSFIVGQFTEAVILGTLCMAGMLILRLPYASAVGVFMGATALIPVFGAWIGAAVGVLLILAVSPVKAIVFLIFVVILQQAENNLIYPRVVGTSIGLPGIWVLAAITVGAGVSGIAGMMISVPFAATAYKLFRAVVKRRLEEQGVHEGA